MNVYKETSIAISFRLVSVNQEEDEEEEEERDGILVSVPVLWITRETAFLGDVGDLNTHVVDRPGSPLGRQDRLRRPHPLAVVAARHHNPELQRSGRRPARAPDRTVVPAHEPPVR